MERKRKYAQTKMLTTKNLLSNISSKKKEILPIESEKGSLGKGNQNLLFINNVHRYCSSVLSTFIVHHFFPHLLYQWLIVIGLKMS